jgi:hypothetical protein
MALSLNSVTPTGHITIIIYWCVGIFNIRGLTFGHDLDSLQSKLAGTVPCYYWAGTIGSG